MVFEVYCNDHICHQVEIVCPYCRSHFLAHKDARSKDVQLDDQQELDAQ